ncbi:MAG: hypothetical protein Q8O89_05510 [Nanoarchaeota archaeon]|nr:hypothetical protein [Nanoarchaeota archaeon]
MPKLTAPQRRELKEAINSGEFSEEQIMEKFKLSKKHVRRQIDPDKKKKQGRPPKEKKIIEETEEDSEELNTEDLVPKPKKQELDQEKDYCGNCYSNGELTEIKKEMAQCPKCNSVLGWQ